MVAGERVTEVAVYLCPRNGEREMPEVKGTGVALEPCPRCGDVR